MDSTITMLRTDKSIDKEDKSAKYFEECGADIQLLHELMGDWGQKTIAFDGPKLAKRKQTQNCVCCGREPGGWDALHNKASSVTGKRDCPFKGQQCTLCNKFGLGTLDTEERYTQHTPEACPLGNIVKFASHVEAHLVEKHAPDKKATSQLSAFD